MDDLFLRQRALDLCGEGYRHHMERDLRQAIELYTKSIDVYPTAEAYTFRGWAYQFLGRIDDAIAECHKAIATDASFGNPYNDIGAYLIAKGELDESVPWLEKAKRAPRYEPRHFPYMNLARVYAAKGMVRQAIQELEEAIRIAPGDPRSVEMIAGLRAMLN